MKDTAEEFARYLSGKHWGLTEVRPPTALPKPSPVLSKRDPSQGRRSGALYGKPKTTKQQARTTFHWNYTKCSQTNI